MYKCFDFQCITCGFIFDDLVNDDENPACPRVYYLTGRKCGEKTERMLGNNPTNITDAKTTELMIKFRAAENKYKGKSKEAMGYEERYGKR